MKNVVFLNSCQEWGGGEKWTLETASALVEREYSVTVAGRKKGELISRARSLGIKTRSTEVKSTFSCLNFYKLFSFAGYLQRNNVDVLFMNLSQDLKFGGLAGKLAGVDKIIYRRGLAVPIKNRFYNRFLLGSCVTDIIANSRATRKTILKNTAGWLDESKIEIIYNGIKLQEVDRVFNKPEVGNNLREELGLNDDTVLIASIGRLTPQKGHEYLFKAVEKIREEFENFKVLVVGSGEREEELRHLVSRLDIEDKIIFFGFREDVYQILKEVDFLLHTALWEGFGYVIAEAMAAGKPVVATDVSNIDEIVSDGRTGYLVESCNPKNIADKTLQMIKSSSRSKMGRAAREVIEQKFSFEKMIFQIENIMT